MSSATKTNSNVYGNTFSKSQEPDNSTIIRRTLVEHGIRPVDDSSTGATKTSTSAAIEVITQQHQEERRELQQLNTKFASYLDQVQYLEDRNQELSADVRQLKETWGGDINHLHGAYTPQLQGLRTELDKAIVDQVAQELKLKRNEYDLWLAQEQIATFDPDDNENQLDALQQELHTSTAELEQLKSLCDEGFNEVGRLQNMTEAYYNEINGLKNELDSHQLERIMLENETQTIKEHVAFLNSIFRVERRDMLSLHSPVMDVSKFYRAELANAISEIRRDFEILFQNQTNDLEAYYKVKTEQVRNEIEAENERKRQLASEGAVEYFDTAALATSIGNDQNALAALRADNQSLQAQLDEMMNDYERIQDENSLARDDYDKDAEQFRKLIEEKRAAVDAILENNVSLNFEISTYKGLLAVEEQHLNRMEGGAALPNSSSGVAGLVLSQNQQQQSSDPLRNTSEMKKMTVQKTARGPISFDLIDLEKDAIVLVNEKYSGSEQSLQNWSIHRQVDQNPEIVYNFPSTFSLKPRQRIQILSKRSPSTAGLLGDTLLADRIDSWGIGQRMVTRLLDNNNDEKALITQKFQ